MTYYIFVKGDILNGSGQCPQLTEGVYNAEVDEELYDDYNSDHDKYIVGTKEIEIEVPDEVEEGEEQTTHIETITVPYPVPNPNYEEEQLALAKQTKYNEANEGAKRYLNGNALYEFEEGKHIEATDGNIAKFTAYALAYVTGQLQPTDTVVWNTKEDETVELNQEQVVTILNGLGQVQAYVWAVQFPYYISLIEAAQTVEEVEAIVIDYTLPIEEE